MREHPFFRSFLFALLACALAALWLLAVLAVGGLPEAKGAPAPTAGQGATPSPGPASTSPAGRWAWCDTYLVECLPGGHWLVCTRDGRRYWAGRWELRGGVLRVDEVEIDRGTHDLSPWAHHHDLLWPNPSFIRTREPFPPLPVAGQAGLQ